MPEICGALLPPIIVGMLMTLLIEQIATPQPRPCWHRSLLANVLHLNGWLMVYCFELLLFQRPWFAASLATGFFTLLIVVNNVKFATLREPFIYQDFEYFFDALRHPRLYIPFFGIWKAVAGLVLFCIVIAVGVSFESSLLDRFSHLQFWGAWLILLGAIAGVLFIGRKSRPSDLSFIATNDVHQYGYIACLHFYAWAEEDIPAAGMPPQWPTDSLEQLPLIVAIQSESYFDPRQLHGDIHPDVLEHYDLLIESSWLHGGLKTPAWGANTVRSEFAFLSGRGATELGVHQFNPYRKFAKQSPFTLARWFKQRGYRTVCIHPYFASFYERDKVFPCLDFDEFIDIEAFSVSSGSGFPYVSDIVLADRITDLIGKTKDPTFVFVITMENHGPLHLEKVAAEDEQQLYTSGKAPPACADLTAYLRHQRNADQMIKQVRCALVQYAQPAILCWYGDHVPIMPHVYNNFGLPDGKTPYAIWRNWSTEQGACRDLVAHELGDALLQCVMSTPQKQFNQEQRGLSQ